MVPLLFLHWEEQHLLVGLRGLSGRRAAGRRWTAGASSACIRRWRGRAGTASTMPLMPPAVLHHLVVVMDDCLEFGPLLGGEDPADTEEHAGVGLLQVGAILCDGVDLSEDFCLVGLIGTDHGAQKNLVLLQSCLEVNQL